jgi:hypothetical protein
MLLHLKRYITPMRRKSIDDAMSWRHAHELWTLKYRWQVYEVGDPDGHMAWIVKELQRAETEGKTVHIVGHVPGGHEECSLVWSRNIYKVMLRYGPWPCYCKGTNETAWKSKIPL